MSTIKPLGAKPRISKYTLLRKYQKEMNRRVNEMHSLAADMCGAHENVEHLRAELRETRKMLLQLIALTE